RCVCTRGRSTLQRKAIAAPRDLDVQLALDLGQMPVMRTHDPCERGVVRKLQLRALPVIAGFLATAAQTATAVACAMSEISSPRSERTVNSLIRTRTMSPIECPRAITCTGCR